MSKTSTFCLNPCSEGERRAKKIKAFASLGIVVLILVLKEKGGPVAKFLLFSDESRLNPCSEGERRALLIINPLNIIEQSRQ